MRFAEIVKDQRIYYLNPPHPDLSIEQELLAGTGFELVPVRVQGEIIDQVADAVAILIIDVPGCRKYGIEVCYVPDYGTEDVANHAIALLFAVHRHLLQYHRSVEQGRWDFKVAGPIHILKELRLGIFGLGRIGSDFAGKMCVFVKEILGYDPILPKAAIESKGAGPSTPEEIFSECEIISLHLPYSAKTH